jgi:hypothetical protein
MIDRLSGVLAKITLGLFFLFLLCVGVLIGGTALHDPDTCWIAALGRYMFEHGGIPSIEPFSYTFVDVHRPLVLYQWMTELCFFGAVKIGGLACLLLLVTTLVLTAFVLVPMRLFHFARVRWYQALPVMILVVVASYCRGFLARPEIFSYVFLSSLLLLLTVHRLKFRRLASGWLGANSATEAGSELEIPGAEQESKHGAEQEQRPGEESIFDFRLLVAIALIMVAWANFHTGFVSGLIILFSYVLANLIARLVCRIQPFCDFTILAASVVGTLGTAFNPYGTGLWRYIPSLFFASFNHRIAELSSVDIRKPEFTPFCLFLAVFVFVWIRKIMNTVVHPYGSQSARTERMQIVESFFIFSVCVFEGWSHLRLIPFVLLVIMAELSLLLSPILNDSKPANHLLNSFDSKLAEGLSRQLRLGSNICLVFALLVALIGTAVCSLKIATPILPQSGGAFELPVKALEVVNSHHASEHILNDPQFGDAMIWYHPNAPKVFVDTRFDMYGENLVRDYMCMRDAEPGWQELIDKYGVKTVFLKPDEVLVQKLKASPAWQIEYIDKKAAVLFRP